jgi:hypothetical protein
VDIGADQGKAADSIKTAEVLADTGLSINQEAFTEGKWKATPLWFAIARGRNLPLAEYLLKRVRTLTIACGQRRSIAMFRRSGFSCAMALT